MNNRGVKLRTKRYSKSWEHEQVADPKTRQKYTKDWELNWKLFRWRFWYLSHLRTILVKQKAAVGLLKSSENITILQSTTNQWNQDKYSAFAT